MGTYGHPKGARCQLSKKTSRKVGQEGSTWLLPLLHETPGSQKPRLGHFVGGKVEAARWPAAQECHTKACTPPHRPHATQRRGAGGGDDGGEEHRGGGGVRAKYRGRGQKHLPCVGCGEEPPSAHLVLQPVAWPYMCQASGMAHGPWAPPPARQHHPTTPPQLEFVGYASSGVDGMAYTACSNWRRRAS